MEVAVSYSNQSILGIEAVTIDVVDDENGGCTATSLECLVMETFREFSTEMIENYSKGITLIPLDMLRGQEEIKKGIPIVKCTAICRYVDNLCHVLSTNSMWRYSAPQILMDVVSNKIVFKYLNRQFSLMHLACIFNRLDLLEWLQALCCELNVCDEVNHCTSCQQRKTNLWSTVKDSNDVFPLFYSIEFGSLECCAFLCSQPIVRDNQLNLKRDHLGNLPIALALQKKDYVMCDTLRLFGATFDVTNGLSFGLGLGESLMHQIMRKQDLEGFRYLATHAPKVILKKNQRGESPLFSCLKDKRNNYKDDYVQTTNFGGKGGVDGKPINVPSYILFFSKVLESSISLLSEDLVQKALLSRNNFGRNILMESILMHDFESSKLLCNYLMNNFMVEGNARFSAGMSSKKYNYLKEFVFDKDIGGMTVFFYAFSTTVRYISLTNENANQTYQMLTKMYKHSSSSTQSLKAYLKEKYSTKNLDAKTRNLVSSSFKYWQKLEDSTE